MHLQPLGQGGPAPWTAARNNGAIRTAAFRNGAIAEVVEVSVTSQQRSRNRMAVVIISLEMPFLETKKGGATKKVQKRQSRNFGVKGPNLQKVFFKLKMFFVVTFSSWM